MQNVEAVSIDKPPRDEVSGGKVTHPQGSPSQSETKPSASMQATPVTALQDQGRQDLIQNRPKACQSAIQNAEEI